MSLQRQIGINARYTRSVNLERDIDSVANVEAYIPTARSLETLRRVVASFEHADAPRAWSLIGPYGSGKSSFAVFLSHLLADEAYETSVAARRVLDRFDPGLASRFTQLGAGTAGHCCILLTGSPEPLSERLAMALWRGARDFWEDRQGRRPAILGTLQTFARGGRLVPSNLELVVRQLQEAVANAKGNGLLIVIDEFGKFLEYEARHSTNDVFLLQVLAEFAFRRHAAPLNLVVMLHQAFEHYAKRLGETLRNEWSKIQGRFENIPFLDSAEQVLRIVAAACRHNLTAAEYAIVRDGAQRAAAVFHAECALPSGLDETQAADLFVGCYPLHPVSALLLPYLCQRVAQNDRTLFSYLGSQEPHGFRETLTRLQRVGDTISPAEIYDYFILNQPAASTSHRTHRRWNEVVTAVERLGDAPPQQVALLKAIGLLNIIGAQGNLKASPAIVALCVEDRPGPLVENLMARSIVQFRRFGNEYRVWAGSDFDLEAELDKARAELRQIDLAKALTVRNPIAPVVARRHSIETGTLRYFQPIFTTVAHCSSSASNGPRDPRLLLFLLESNDSQEAFLQAIDALSDCDLAVACGNVERLKEALIEVMALDIVRRGAQGLQGDPVAQRELRELYDLAERRFSQELSHPFDHPGEVRWYWRGQELAVRNKGALQHALSQVLDNLFRHSPLMRNELINRDQPSSQAAAGRNKLLTAMLEHPDLEDLGIAKFPPEKAMYRALLRASGLHRRENGAWGFQRPPAADPFRFGAVYSAIDD